MNSRNISKNEQLSGSKIFDNLKSDYFLRKIFDIMKKIKSLVIVKYNKKLQKRLNINVNDYKQYSSIEIELNLNDDKCIKFINIPDKEQKFYHIYFDNSNEEIKNYHLIYKKKVKKVKIIIDYQVKSFKGLFKRCFCINSIFFKQFYINNITDMSEMFSDCFKLKEIDLSNFNTSNVTDMSNMFYSCDALKELNLSNFNTCNVTDMSNMFNCYALKELDLSTFNTNKYGQNVL